MGFALATGAIGAAIGLSGCGSSKNELFPITEHSRWNYTVRAVKQYQDHVSYSGRVAVGLTNGYELKSDMGVLHLAWSGGSLITDQMAGSHMRPGLPLLTSSSGPTSWAGWIDSDDRSEPEPAKATISCVHVKLDLHGTTVDTVRSNILIILPGKKIDLVSWFQPGLGLVRQEQQTNGKLDVMMEYLNQS
jgi:hypothetical protein